MASIIVDGNNAKVADSGSIAAVSGLPGLPGVFTLMEGGVLKNNAVFRKWRRCGNERRRRSGLYTRR